MPESRHKYLYERLGDHDFQLLVAALLTARFADFVPLPLRQADGGRDGVLRTSSEKALVYQVKWSVNGKHKDPVAWLDAVVLGEKDNLRRLAAEGVRRYTLVTNVPSTGKPKTGTFDRLNSKLDAHAKAYGLEQMSCLWREAVDGMVDDASTEIKWQYAEMLAGWDLIRYLISEEVVERKDRGLRALVRKVAATQWDDDELVKFSQVDIDREKVVDLFIDVGADRISKEATSRHSRHHQALGGTAAHLLRTTDTHTLIRGAPGQGKSTLSQYISQVHRAAFMPSRLRPPEFPEVTTPLFPLRLDLSVYARWISGIDVWDKESETTKKSIKRPAAQSTIECFLAELITHASGGVPTTAKDVQDIFERVPSMVVLDGLDEVGRPKTRVNIVEAINQFCRRSNYIGELAGNPMQLTILLDLLHKHGEATPTQRTELYDSYVDLLLAREANKHPQSVKNHQKQLREIVPFLGWYLQSRSEEDNVHARMSIADLKAAIRHFQYTYGKPESVVDELFEATSDRLWALTSKNEGTFEFEVLSLREYFAARFLYRYAGEDIKGFDKNTVFRELLRRPYWLNTARFYGGNAEGGDVYVLADGIHDEIIENCAPPSLVAAWTLLTDGVFASRPRQARIVLNDLCAAQNVSTLVDALDRKEISSLPELPQLPDADGPDPTWTRLTEQLGTDPGSPETPRRVRALRELLGRRAEFTRWWAHNMPAAINRPTQDAWLEMAATCEAAAGCQLHLDGVDLSRPLVAQLVLDTGLIPPPGSKFEADLTRAVLDGRCPNVSSIRSMPAQIAVALGLDGFLTASLTGFTGEAEDTRRLRQEAAATLRKSACPFATVAAHRRFKAGEKGSTFPWANTATALFELAGHCWLASQIAIVGAASPYKLGFTRHPETTSFGAYSHPTTLIAETRAHADDQQWWRHQLDLLSDARDETGADAAAQIDLARAEWALALWCVAQPHVVSSLITDWQTVFANLADIRRSGISDVAFRVGAYGWLDALPNTVIPANDAIRTLVAVRGRRYPPPDGQQVMLTRAHPQPVSTPLLAIARAEQWLKVDAVATYR